MFKGKSSSESHSAYTFLAIFVSFPVFNMQNELHVEKHLFVDRFPGSHLETNQTSSHIFDWNVGFQEKINNDKGLTLKQ